MNTYLREISLPKIRVGRSGQNVLNKITENIGSVEIIGPKVIVSERFARFCIESFTNAPRHIFWIILGFCLFYFYIDIQIQFDNDIQRVFLDDRLAHDNVFYNTFLPVAGTSCDRLETPKQSKAAHGSALVCLDAVPFLPI